MSNRDPAPWVSVVVPTYNRRRFLGEAVESCVRQSWANTEVVVVDDGSTDGTAAWLERTGRALGDERFRFCVQENRGQSAARNAGIRLARGTYIKFLDSDDALHPGAIEAHVVAMQRHGTDLSIGSRAPMSPEGKVWSVTYRAPPGIVDRPLLRFYRLDLRPQGALWCYARSVFEEVRWNEDLRAREDTELLAQLLCRGATVCGAPEAVYHQRYHAAGRAMETQFGEKAIEAILGSNERQLQWLHEARADRATRRAFASSLSRTVLRLWGEHRPAARRLLATARRAVRFPELTLLPEYGRATRAAAYVLWLVGGPRLCHALWLAKTDSKRR